MLVSDAVKQPPAENAPYPGLYTVYWIVALAAAMMTTIALLPPYVTGRLIDGVMLTGAERHWLDAYHASLAGKLSHLLDDTEKAWLAAATRPL